MNEFTLTREQIQQRISNLSGTKQDIINGLSEWMKANDISELEKKQILNDLESYPEFRMKGVN